MKGNRLQSKGQASPVTIGIAAGIVLLAIAATIFFLSRPSAEEAAGPPTEEVPSVALTECGTDQDCLVRHAQECTPAQGIADIAGMTVRNEVLEDCILRKTIIAIPPEEPEEIRALFEETSMECAYDKGAFDPKLAFNLTIGIERCEGLLKDSIDAFVEALEEQSEVVIEEEAAAEATGETS